MLRLRQLFSFSILLTAFVSCAQEDTTASGPRVERFYYKLGQTQVSVRKTTFKTADNWFFILLHDNENTAETAALTFLQQHGGTLISIENNDKRLIPFSLGGKTYQFDPNRIFTAKGIRQNLHLFNNYTVSGAKAIAGFRNFILEFIPDMARVIAVHNNTEGRYTIGSYKKEKALKKEAAAVHINPNQDSDDFFITTGHGLFKKLKLADYSCVLQHSKTATDDGSLSFYCAQRNQSYVNVEAQTGHLAEQQQMLEVLRQALQQ